MICHYANLFYCFQLWIISVTYIPSVRNMRCVCMIKYLYPKCIIKFLCAWIFFFSSFIFPICMPVYCVCAMMLFDGYDELYFYKGNIVRKSLLLFCIHTIPYFSMYECVELIPIHSMIMRWCIKKFNIMSVCTWIHMCVLRDCNIAGEFYLCILQ